LEGYGYEVFMVAGDDPMTMHALMATTLDTVLDRIHTIQGEARRAGEIKSRPRWPMIVLKSPKGWTGPKFVDGKKVEGFWRAHQVPVTNVRDNPEHLAILENWMKSYAPETLFDETGRLVEELRALAPVGDRRMGANPHANGGALKRDLILPNYRNYAATVDAPGKSIGEATRIMGEYLRDVMKLNNEARNFRLMGPDEVESNRLQAVFETTDRVWMERIEPYDVHLARDGRVMEVLSEHLCQGWLEGYLLTGRHGFFTCYEAFIHIVDSMVNQHAKWLKVTRELRWRRPIASLNYLLTSHVWRQDHNGFSHQDPGFVDLLANKKSSIVRLYFPPDANTLLCVTDHCLRTYNRINVIVAGKQPSPQWLTMDDAERHVRAGIGIWSWAGSDVAATEGVANMVEPDLVMACAGDVPTLETLAAVDLLRQAFPDLKIRVVNVVDLMTLETHEHHPHGLSDRDFDSLFTRDKPVIFAYHGYPYLIHRLTYDRANHANFHVRGFMEEGTTTTPFDMVVSNELDRFHLAIEAIERVDRLGVAAAHVKQQFQSKLIEHHEYIRAHGEDMPEIREWTWPYQTAANAGD
jgi:xylulose-5-phosphate/fructose-6-phosphate phosphoketolase